MYKIIGLWNLSSLADDKSNLKAHIDFRGFNSDIWLTGEHSANISEKKMSALSVANISASYCPAKIDLYYSKGINKNKVIGNGKRRQTWGSKAGHMVENYASDLLQLEISNKIATNHIQTITECDTFTKNFFQKAKWEKCLKEMNNLASGSLEDPDWLKLLIRNNGRLEMAHSILNSLIFKRLHDLKICDMSIDPSGKKLKLKPKAWQIGISSPSTPDFLIKASELIIIGEIKTGERFTEAHPLTCAGYALAYENEGGNGTHVDWGVVYFLPTFIPTRYGKPMTFAQVYIFPIDDGLREYFVQVRDQAYNIISRPNPPTFPTDRQKCPQCRYLDVCDKRGLTL